MDGLVKVEGRGFSKVIYSYDFFKYISLRKRTTLAREVTRSWHYYNASSG